MVSSTRCTLVTLSTLALLTTVACDPQVATPGEAQHLEDTDGPDGDEDSAEGNATDSRDDAEGGSSVGTGEDCEGDDECSDPDEPPPPGETHAFAIHWGDVPEIDIGESDSGGSGDAGPGPFDDPESILVSIGNGAGSCADPWAASGCGTWNVSFTLPSDVVPGSYSLIDVNGSQSVSGVEEDDPDVCWGGGGTLEGTLVIEAIDDTTIVGHIEDAQAIDFEANLAFAAPLCP